MIPSLQLRPEVGAPDARSLAIYPHKRFQDPKVRLTIDYMAERCQRLNGKALE